MRRYRTVQRREANSLSDRIPLLTNYEIDLSCDNPAHLRARSLCRLFGQLRAVGHWPAV
jgi:hypothetical protein